MSASFLQYRFDPGYQQLGIRAVVIAELRGIDNTRPLDTAAISALDAIAEQALTLDEAALTASPVLQGYRQCVAQIGRSAKKFPPSASALIGIVQRAGRLPSISPVVDLYNGVALQSHLSLGVHDMDTLHAPIEFRFSPGEERFVPIGGGEKTTQRGDYVYADQQTILAWLDARDSELVKVTEATRNLLIVAQGNAATSVTMRCEVLAALCTQITVHCGGSFQIVVIDEKGCTVIVD